MRQVEEQVSLERQEWPWAVAPSTPITGRFLTRDPHVGLTGQLYTYAGDDPLSLADPWGLVSGCASNGLTRARWYQPSSGTLLVVGRALAGTLAVRGQ